MEICSRSPSRRRRGDGIAQHHAGRSRPFADMGERRAETIWDSIALHTTASIAHGIACDYGGVGYQELSDDNKKAILSAYPRLDMKNQLTACLCGRTSSADFCRQRIASNTPSRPSR